MTFEAYTLDGHKVEVALKDGEYILAIRPDHNDYEPVYLTKFDAEGIAAMRDALSNALGDQGIPPVRLEQIFADALRDRYTYVQGDRTYCSCGVILPPDGHPVEERHVMHHAHVLVDKLRASTP